MYLMLQDDDGWTWKKRSVIYFCFILTLRETKKMFVFFPEKLLLLHKSNTNGRPIIPNMPGKAAAIGLNTTQQNPKTNVDGTKNYHSESGSSLCSVTVKI